MSATEPLTTLHAGMPIVVGGDRVVRVSDALAAAFGEGDRLLVVDATGDLLHVPAEARRIARDAVDRAVTAFGSMGGVDDRAVDRFFGAFADRLADDDTIEPVLAANRADIDAARSRGRSTTRLELTPGMRDDMIAGLRAWAEMPSGRGTPTETVQHDGWSVELMRAGLGVVGFVFEGRPNVFADACGVIRSGNTVVFRIGSDALGTARAIVEHALDPALADAGLPPGTASLIDSPSRATGWSMFSDPRLGLAVARGSGTAVSQLGAVAQQAGNPVSLHGTGGAWMLVGESADPDWLGAAVTASLDRKVCNTLNTCCVTASRAEELMPVVIDAVDRAASHRGTNARLHVVGDAASFVPVDRSEPIEIARAEGLVVEPGCSLIEPDGLGTEWEWEDSPEVTLCVVDDLDEAVELFNRHSPRFVVSVISEDVDEHERVFAAADAPFVGNGFTRWVDGQYALGRPELGLSNWEFGRLFGRGGVLSGDSVYSIRTRVRQTRADIAR